MQPLVLFSSNNDTITDPDDLVNANSFSADGFDKGVVSTGWPGAHLRRLCATKNSGEERRLPAETIWFPGMTAVIITTVIGCVWSQNEIKTVDSIDGTKWPKLSITGGGGCMTPRGRGLGIV